MFFNRFPYTDFHELNADWIIRHFKEFIDFIKEIDGWIDNHEKEYEELKQLYDDILSGDFPDAMIEQLKQWCIKNTTEIIGAAIKTAFFGLENGYLVAYIPDSWNDIVFGTSGLDDFPTGVDFGHLTLTY